jgi:hypothetical protein
MLDNDKGDTEDYGISALDHIVEIQNERIGK